jgi:hypothetical protein
MISQLDRVADVEDTIHICNGEWDAFVDEVNDFMADSRGVVWHEVP